MGAPWLDLFPAPELNCFKAFWIWHLTLLVMFSEAKHLWLLPWRGMEE
jgi:hypothetical protein